MSVHHKALKRVLGLGELTFFGVGVILGAGIYALVGRAAGLSGTMLWLSFCIASATALLSAFAYAELSAMFPRAGGEYVYARNALGPGMAVFLGLMVAANSTVSGATISLAFAGYLAKLVNIGTFAATAGILALILGINIAGIRQSSWFNIVFTIIELAGLGMVVYAALPYVGSVSLIELPPGGWNGIMMGAALSFYAYMGFEDLVKLAEEAREPQKTLPRALFLSSGIILVVYLLIAVVSVSAVPWPELSRSDSPLALVLETGVGATAALVISVIALFSTSNTILSNMLAASRVLLDMAGDSTLFRPLAYIAPRLRTPVLALALVAVLMVCLSFIGDITTIALIANMFIYSTFFMVNICVLVLRFRRPELERPFRIPGAIGRVPVPVVLALALTLLMLGYNIATLAGR